MSVSRNFVSLVGELALTTGLSKSNVMDSQLADLALEVVRKRLRPRSKAAVRDLKSPDKKRYIVAPLLYQQSSGAVVQNSLRAIHGTLHESIVRSESETGPKVLSLSSLEAALIKERFPSLLIEPDVQYSLARTPLLREVQPIQVPASGSKSLTVEIRGSGKPVAGAHVVLYTDIQQNTGYEGFTDPQGRLRISVRKSDSIFQKISVVPKTGFWSRTWKDMNFSAQMTLDILPLTLNGFDWGLAATEAAVRGNRNGKGVKVAIIDSGIGPHSSLNVTGGKNLIDSEDESGWGDHDGHGTHCAGVIAALEAKASTWGYAPNVELYALRVFGGSDGGGYASDIGDAIEWAVQHGCDIVSMSLTSETPSSYIRSKIEKAVDKGVLCVAAAGNEGGPVLYPAKFRNVLGVSAVGKPGTFPEDSIHEEAQSTVKSSDKQYFFASFSNRGEEVDLCAPGVAVTSTLPGDAFGAWDGTSMACPHVAGIAALALEASPEILKAPRDAERMGLLLDRVMGLCTDLGMPQTHQGAGLPRLGKLFLA